MINVHSKLKGY